MADIKDTLTQALQAEFPVLSARDASTTVYALSVSIENHYSSKIWKVSVLESTNPRKKKTSEIASLTLIQHVQDSGHVNREAKLVGRFINMRGQTEEDVRYIPDFYPKTIQAAAQAIFLNLAAS